MSLKKVLDKIKFRKLNKNKTNANNSYCYTNVVWNTENNLIILVSFSEDYFGQIIELQDAINYTWQGLKSKIVYSSYDEEVTRKDENGKSFTDLLIHKKYYMLIGGSPLAWQELYMNIHDLGNEVLGKITNEIINNCDSDYFRNLIDDGVFNNFYKNENILYDIPLVTKNNLTYTNPVSLIERLPNGFTGKDILKFINIYNSDGSLGFNAYGYIINLKYMPNALFKNHDLYPLYSALFKNVTIEKLNMVLEPLYKQPDDDSIPGDITDEALDEIFREHYERFSAVSDNNIEYEDIDEVLEEDEETENMRDEDKL